MRGPGDATNSPLFEYTLMPTHMRRTFGVDELQDVELVEPFGFTKGCRTMRVRGRSWINPHQFGTMLFDLASDPGQERPLDDPQIEEYMAGHLVRLMEENEAPAEQYQRLGLAT